MGGPCISRVRAFGPGVQSGVVMQPCTFCVQKTSPADEIGNAYVVNYQRKGFRGNRLPIVGSVPIAPGIVLNNFCNEKFFFFFF